MLRQDLLNWIPSAGEISVAGVYIPSLLVYALLGFAGSYTLCSVMQARGWSRHIWHLPLFFMALWFLFTFSLGFLLYPARL
jgi:hypothetical protein